MKSLKRCQYYISHIFRALLCKGPRHLRRYVCFFTISFVVMLCFVELTIFTASLNFKAILISIGIPLDKTEESKYEGPSQVIDIYYSPLDNVSLANFLHREVRVLCFVLTCPKYHLKKARHVERTWGKRCNKLLFMTSKDDKILRNTVVLPINENYEFLWGKTSAALKHIYTNYLDEADWFLKADDDTYFIMENLRYLLYPYSSKTPIYFGCKFKPLVKHGYMSGGAGYVLSREAVRRFVELAMPNPKLCDLNPKDYEDVMLGRCLQKVNVIAGDSRDKNGRRRFFPLDPNSHIVPNYIKDEHWLWHYVYYKTYEGFNCCSDYAISFHYIRPSQMYVFEYMIYHIRPYGVVGHHDALPAKLKVGQQMPPPQLPHTTTIANTTSVKFKNIIT